MPGSNSNLPPFIPLKGRGLSLAPYFSDTSMLFTDSDLVTAYDLKAVDGEADAVSRTEKINLDGPQSIIRQAWAECSSHLNKHLQAYGGFFGSSGSANHIGAVMNTGIYSSTAPIIMLYRVVAHNWRYDNSPSDIQLWVIYAALAKLYRNASNRKGVDRYQEKAERFNQEAIDKWGDFVAQGLPAVIGPIEAPGALHAHGAGMWAVSTAAGNGTTTTTYKVCITYYDASAYVSQLSKANAESGPSASQDVAVITGNNIRVDITGLQSPTGSQAKIGTSEGLTLTRPATHWNIYVAATPVVDGLLPVYYYQTSLPIATKTFTLAGDPVLSGTIMDQGQFPDPGYNLMISGSTINRG